MQWVRLHNVGTHFERLTVELGQRYHTRYCPSSPQPVGQLPCILNDGLEVIETLWVCLAC